jgi:hypothetical protein
VVAYRDTFAVSHVAADNSVTVREYKLCCCASLNVFTVEGVINELEQNVHRWWKCNGEQFILGKSSSEGHLLLLELISFHCTLRAWKLFPVQIYITVIVQI